MTTIRLATPDDAQAVRSIYAPFVRETAIAFETEVPPVDTLRDRITARLERHPWLVCERDGDVVGYAAADDLRTTPPYDWTVELSVYIAEGHRRSGVGRGLYTSLFAVLRWQGFYNAYAITTLPNPASVAFHEAMGFTPAGDWPALGYKHGEWHDARWWRRPLGERPDDPDPPTPLAELPEARLEAALAAGTEHVEP